MRASDVSTWIGKWKWVNKLSAHGLDWHMEVGKQVWGDELNACNRCLLIRMKGICAHYGWPKGSKPMGHEAHSYLVLPKHSPGMRTFRKKLMTDRSRTGASARPRLGPARPAAPPRSPLLPGLSSTCSPTIHAWDTESAHAFYPPVCMCFYVPSPIHTNRYYSFYKASKKYFICSILPLFQEPIAPLYSTRWGEQN